MSGEINSPRPMFPPHGGCGPEPEVGDEVATLVHIRRVKVAHHPREAAAERAREGGTLLVLPAADRVRHQPVGAEAGQEPHAKMGDVREGGLQGAGPEREARPRLEH